MTATGTRFRVWGCRGSLPVPGALTLGYGGDTSCYEVADGAGGRIVVDCGSGLRRLGERLMAEGPPETLDILLTHLHFDHLLGLGFFAPLLQRRTAVRIWSPLPSDEVETAIGRLYGPPLWPIRIPGDYPLPVARLDPGECRIGAAQVSFFPLNHPGGAHGYRIRLGGALVCVVTDHEHGDAGIDAGIREAVRGADLMLYDAAYSEAEYATRHGWGHSTWEEAVRVARAAGVRRTLLAHHSTQSEDWELDAKRPLLGGADNSVMPARDGLEVLL